MDIEEFRKRGYEAVDRICKYYQELENYKGMPYGSFVMERKKTAKKIFLN